MSNAAYFVLCNQLYEAQNKTEKMEKALNKMANKYASDDIRYLRAINRRDIQKQLELDILQELAEMTETLWKK